MEGVILLVIALGGFGCWQLSKVRAALSDLSHGLSTAFVAIEMLAEGNDPRVVDIEVEKQRRLDHYRASHGGPRVPR